MAMNKDHFHTRDNFKIAGKIIDQVSALKQRNAELEAELAVLKEERRWRKFPNEKPEWGNMRTCESSCITHLMPQPKTPEAK